MSEEQETEITRCSKCRQDFEADNTIAGYQCPRCLPKATPKSLDAAFKKLAEKFNQAKGKKD